MPNEETTDSTIQTTNQPGGDTPPANEPSVEQLRQQLADRERELASKNRELEGAQSYVQNLMGVMRTAAERPAGAPAAPVDDRPLAERLAENPEAVLDEHFRTRMGPIVQGYLGNQDVQNRELARERILRDESMRDADGVSYWDKYEGEMNQFMEGMPPEVRARPGAYERAMKFVLANHLDEVADDRAARVSKRREERERGAFTEGSSGAAHRVKQPEGLSPLEKEIAKGLGMKDEEFLQAKRMDQFGNQGS